MRSIGRAVGAVSFAFVVAASTMLGTPAAIEARSSLGSSSELLGSLLSVASPFASVFDALTGVQGLDPGSDGRLTVLLLGSDSRGTSVSRTDTIMIMSIKGDRLSVASIPRDTARIPNPFAGGTFKPRVNAILKSLVAQSGGNVEAGMQKFDQVIENVLQIHIDYHALITFRGFDALVDTVDPIYINNTQTIKDPKFWDDPRFVKGVYFPAASNWALYAWHDGPFCTGQWKTAANPLQYACHHALPFVRSRKGPSNSDFQRARRQQNFVTAVMHQVASGELNSLVSVANGQAGARALWTNIPISVSTASEVYNLVHSATLSSVDQVVFAPSTYSTHIPGGTAYQLNLSAVRSWIATHMN